MAGGGFGHLDASGRLRMVDVSAKPETARVAVAACVLRMRPETLDAIGGGKLPKGDVLAVAQVAGVLAAKRTPELIPGCHPVRLSSIEVSFEPDHDESALAVRVDVRGDDRTGFEMEALTACSIAALTVYDMCKGIDPDMRVTELRLVHKEGGKSGPVARARPAELPGARTAILTVSTLGAAGKREDTSGKAIAQWLAGAGAEVVATGLVGDDRHVIADTLREMVERHAPDVIVTTGGTGVGPADVTPEATLDVAHRVVPGLAEAMRRRSLEVTPHAMISRGVAVIVHGTLILNLPGSPKAVVENLDAVAPALGHAVELLRGGHPH